MAKRTVNLTKSSPSSSAIRGSFALAEGCEINYRGAASTSSNFERFYLACSGQPFISFPAPKYGQEVRSCHWCSRLTEQALRRRFQSDASCQALGTLRNCLAG